MERSEHSLVPEWLKGSGSITGSGNSNQQFTSSSSHSDNHSALRHRTKLSVGSDHHDTGRISVLDRTTSAYFRRSSSSNGSTHLRSYSSFAKGHREKDWDKDNNGYHEREKAVLSDCRNRNYSDYLDSMLPGIFEKDVLRRSQSMITGKCSDTWSRKASNESSAYNKSNHSNDNCLLSIASPVVGNKSSFEHDFPVLGAEERQVGSEVARVLSPGLITAVQSLPLGNSVSGSDRWTSALADVPVGIGSSGTGVAVASRNVSAGSASITPTMTTGLNMAETLAQGPSCARTPPLLHVGNQRLEELAIKQLRQLIPLVTTTTTKTLVVSPSEKSKPKAGQQQHHPLLSLNHTRGGISRSDSPKVSTESRLQILKPSRELNGVSLTTKDNLSPTNVSSKLVGSPLGVTPSAAASAPLRSSGNNPRFATVDHNQTALRITIEKRPTAQAQSRNDFFNLLKKKSTTSSSSSVPDSSPAVSPSVSKKSDGLGTEDSNASAVLKEGGVPSSEISIADLPTNKSEITHNGDSYSWSQQCTSNGDRHSSPDDFLYPDEEEAAFLRSLGWEENAGDDEGLTEEEISAFFKEYLKLKPSAELLHPMQPIGPLNSHNGTHGGASSKLNSMDSNREGLTCQKF